MSCSISGLFECQFNQYQRAGRPHDGKSSVNIPKLLLVPATQLAAVTETDQ
jgi:hypothetical protein